jgi:phenylpropionate dioxygenase-like ring-hydroxylating dioxygenase large terminal subunit
MDPFAEIKACYEAGRVLPGLAFRNPDVYEAEVEGIFKTSWISITCGQNVPQNGDLFPIRIAGQSLFVVRDEEGQVKVFYNVCRHRGARLVGEACQAKGGKIVCPYHAWAFGTDGQLKSAPYLDRGTKKGPLAPVDMDQLGLFPVRSVVWRDIVFVNLSGDAEPFEDFIRPLADRISNWAESELRPLSTDEYEIQADWKLAAENFLDVYHLPVVHTKAIDSFGGALATVDIEISEDIIGIVMTEGALGADAPESDWLLPKFPDLREDQKDTLEIIAIFPNTMLIVEPDCQQTIVLRPQSAGVMTQTLATYVVSDASQVEARAEERKELRREAMEVNDEDAVLLAALQQTRSMEIAGETVPSEAWDTTPQRFQQLWVRKLLAGR